MAHKSDLSISPRPLMFELTLINTKVRQYNSMMLFIILLTIGVFVLTFVYSPVQFTRNIVLIGAFLCAAALGADLLFRKKGRELPKLHYLPLFIAGMTWLIAGNYWGVACTVLLGALFAIAQRRLLVQVNNQSVSYPSFPRRTIEWNELNNLILKDGLLTIDFKNDKILQFEIIESPAAPNEEEFNEFCRLQLGKREV